MDSSENQKQFSDEKDGDEDEGTPALKSAAAVSSLRTPIGFQSASEVAARPGDEYGESERSRAVEVATVSKSMDGLVFDDRPSTERGHGAGTDVERRPVHEEEFVFDNGHVIGASHVQPSLELFKQGVEEVAPFKPDYLELARTTFPSPKKLDTLRSDLNRAFPACSIDVLGAAEDFPCGYACTALRLHSVVEFEVCIFAQPLPKTGHLVEVRHLMGCRYAFSQAAADLTKCLGVDFSEGFKPLAFGPPPLPAGFTPPSADFVPLALPGPCTVCLALLAPESSCTDQIQGARAAAALAAPHDGISTAPCCDQEAHYFAAGGEGCAVADRILVVAVEADSAELRAVAAAAMANIAALAHAAPYWLIRATAVVAKLAEDESLHVRREALRAGASLATRDKALAKLLFPIREVLDVEAHDDKDAALKSFAKCAHAACLKN